MFSPYTKTGRGRKKDRERKMGRVGGREGEKEREWKTDSPHILAGS